MIQNFVLSFSRLPEIGWRSRRSNGRTERQPLCWRMRSATALKENWWTGTNAQTPKRRASSDQMNDDTAPLLQPNRGAVLLGEVELHGAVRRQAVHDELRALGV